jgi:hypothetical protein
MYRLVKPTFWSKHCWIEAIIEIDKDNTWRDPNKTSELSFENQSRAMATFSAARQIFEAPVWHATLPHRQVFSGEYVNKAFKDRNAFDREVSLRRGVNGQSAHPVGS